jgi:branched-chain amino acid transport system substrate-binding protein
MSKRLIAAIAALAVCASVAMTHQACAQEVKVGVVLPFTGIGAEFAQQMDRGMELYLKLNADQVKPYKITIIKRDSKNPGGADAKVAVQELLTQDKVDALAGWVYSPNAIASAPIVTAGHKLAVIMNAGTAFITNLSPDFVRT